MRSASRSLGLRESEEFWEAETDFGTGIIGRGGYRVCEDVELLWYAAVLETVDVVEVERWNYGGSAVWRVWKIVGENVVYRR